MNGRGADWAVFTVEAGVAHLRRPQVGRQNGDFAEIRDGLAEGATVIVHPADTVRDGVRIKTL